MLFGIGLVGFFSRRNMIVMFLAAEMMLQGVSVSLVAWGRYHNDWGGQILVIFILTVAACEAAIALALVLMLYPRSGTLDIAVWHTSARQPAGLRRSGSCPRPTHHEPTWPHLTPAGIEPPHDDEEICTAPCLKALEDLDGADPGVAAGGDADHGLFGKHVLKRAQPSADGRGADRLVRLAACCCCSRCDATSNGARGRSDGGQGHRNRRLAKQSYNVWTWADGRQAIRQAERRTSTAREPAPTWPTHFDFGIDVTLGPIRSRAIMLSMVTFISSLVAIYVDRLHARRPGYWRFFTYYRCSCSR